MAECLSQVFRARMF